MSLQVEKLEKNMAKLTIEVPAEEFDAAIKNAYNKNKNKFSIPILDHKINHKHRHPRVPQKIRQYKPFIKRYQVIDRTVYNMNIRWFMQLQQKKS